MKYQKGINIKIGNINIVEIVPMEIDSKNWFCVGFEEKNKNREDNLHLALILSPITEKPSHNLLKDFKKSLSNYKNILCRIHSECILGDALHSGLCDCGKQLDSAIKMINKNGVGILIYLRQEGRGIGLRNKLSCLSIQEGYLKGKKINIKYSPDQANLFFSHPIDNRNYSIAIELIKLIRVKSLNLISGNPQKIETFKKYGIKVKKIVDIPRYKKITKREMVELKEKINRKYKYPFLF